MKYFEFIILTWSVSLAFSKRFKGKCEFRPLEKYADQANLYGLVNPNMG